MANFDKVIDKVLINEGGYVNDPHDSGGETNFGISKRAYPNVNIKELTTAGAKSIYKKDYWDKVKGDDIANDLVAYELFDTAVNMGVRTASKLIQAVADVHPDGFIGNKSLKAINNMDIETLITKFKLVKIARYLHIVKRNSKNRKFFFGWVNRVMGD